MKRDMRDPQKLGEMILWEKNGRAKDISTSDIASFIDREGHVPDYDKNESMQTVAQGDYLEETIQKTREGDKYAARVLSHLPGRPRQAGHGCYGERDTIPPC